MYNNLDKQESAITIIYSLFLGSKRKAIIVGLHFLKSKQIKAVDMMKLKAACKQYCIPAWKTASKSDLLRTLGQVLFEKKKLFKERMKVNWCHMITWSSTMPNTM